MLTPGTSNRIRFRGNKRLPARQSRSPYVATTTLDRDSNPNEFLSVVVLSLPVHADDHHRWAGDATVMGNAQLSDHWRHAQRADLFPLPADGNVRRCIDQCSCPTQLRSSRRL